MADQDSNPEEPAPPVEPAAESTTTPVGDVGPSDHPAAIEPAATVPSADGTEPETPPTGGVRDESSSDSPDGRDAADAKGRRRRNDRERPEAPPTGDQVNQVSNHFYSDVYADGSTFGSHGGERPGRPTRRVTGKLSDEEVEAVVSRYARPQCFDEATRRLRYDRVVVIEGQPGVGRRAGAINLLREVTSGRLVVLSPSLTLRELAEREYTEGFGYLVVDRVRDEHATDLDFTWSNVSDQVRDGGAFLVVTSAVVAVRAASRAVRHVTWERPSVEEVLRAQLRGEDRSAEDVAALMAELVDQLPEECTLPRLVELARLVGSGVPPTEALKKLEENAAREVQGWFAEKLTHREIVEVAALCFLEGADVRTFETLMERLQDTMARRLPTKRARNAAKQDGDTFSDRGARTGGGGLITVKDVRSSARTTSVMVFKDDAYRRFVLEELWKSRSVAFWDAIGEWLDEIINTSGDSLAVASGLAWLACASFEEVKGSYLDQWSWGALGWQGQVTATYVLWYMCHREALAPIALQTAVRWAGDRDIDRRWTAIVAFGGELGLCYPTDAVNRLWQLTARSDALLDTGCMALACLFAILSDDEHGDAGVVLTLLDRKMETFGIGGGNGRTRSADLMRLRHLTMSASLAVVQVASIRHRRPAIFDFLHDHPRRTAVVARIWAGVIRYRPFRRQAIVALRRGLHALREISEKPREDARALGAALSDALPVDERLPFKNEFMTIDEQLRRGQQESPADVLLACLEAISLIAQETQPGGVK